MKEKLIKHGKKIKRKIYKNKVHDDSNEENFYLKNKKIIRAIVLLLFLFITYSVIDSILNKDSGVFSDLSVRDYKIYNEIDWVDDRDLCRGTRQSSINSNVYYFKSKSNFVNFDLPILKGYRWATTREYKEMINKPNSSKVYTSQCGYSGIPTDINGNKQKNFYFHDSGKTGRSVNVSSNEGQTDFIKKSDSDSFAGYVLIKD